MILEIQQKDVGEFVVLELAGRITLGRDCQELEWKVDDLVRANRTRIIFDLTNLKFMDSSGIGILVMCSAKIKGAGGELRLAGATGVVKQTLELTRVDKIVPVYATVAEATSGLSDAARAS